MNIRVIARLDIKGPNLVKGIHMEGLRVLGKPEDFARHYYETGADELIYMDTVASLYQRNSLVKIIERTAREIFIPLCVGGGLRSVEDIRTVLRAGADKVSINTAAIRRPELIREAAKAFGSSTIVISIEAKRRAAGEYEAWVDYGRQSTGVNALDWAKQAVELGAGELLVTAIDREGTGLGFDLELTRQIAESVPVPVIAAGGAGSVEHVSEVITTGRADAVCLASLLHYDTVRYLPFSDANFQSEGNIEYLRQAGGPRQISPASLPAIKAYLTNRSIRCREKAVG